LADASKTRQAEPVVMFANYGGRSASNAVVKLVIGRRLRSLYLVVRALMCAQTSRQKRRLSMHVTPAGDYY
jgi:hypothetical protein